VLRISAFGATDGDALAGDSATGFFDAGAIEAARGGTGSDSSAATGIPKVASGTWTYDAAITDLPTFSSADFAGRITDETGAGGLLVYQTNPTLLDVTVNDLLTFTETAGDATCAAGDFWIKGNSSTNLLRGCENGSLFTLSTGTSPIDIATPEELTIATGAVTSTCASDNICSVDIATEGGAGTDDLTTYNCTQGSYHILRANVTTNTVVLQAHSGPDFSLDSTEDYAVYFCDTTNLPELVSRSNGG
jgi:hypothetical protein